jgi:hypothetical protein
MGNPARRHMHARGIENGEVKRVLHELIESSPDPSRFLEVYYWAAEPNMAEFFRQFLALSDSARRTLTAFMNMTRNAENSVTVTIGLKGELTLSSPAVSDAMKLRSAVSNSPDPPEILH